jgi:DNA end-binding protein Ku
VLFNPEELKALEEKATNSIDIAEFVPLPKVERIYVDKIYYLGPDKGGERAYRLLSEALKETNRAAIGQYAARGQENLVLVRPMDGVLVMEQLHYADEIRPASEVPIGEGEVKKTELALAKQLIEQTSTEEFKPENYRDKVKDRVLEAIHKKVDGQEITAEPAPEQGAKIIDLMEALKASLSKEKGDRKPAKRATEEKPARVAKVAKGGR